MSKKTDITHFGTRPLFSMAKTAHKKVETEEFKKVAAWFLGPKGENGDFLTRLVSDSIQEHAAYRSEHYKKGDPPYIDSAIKSSPEYISACQKLADIRSELSNLLHRSVPFFSLRYQAHMNWDTVLPASIGYITAMLYNQNNVATEGGPETCALEKEVGEQLCSLMGFDREQSWGHITADGTIANLEAMWVARNLKFYPLAIKEMLMATPRLEKAENELTVQIWELDGPSGLSGSVVQKLLVDCTVWQLLNLDSDQIMALPGEVVKLCNLEDGEIDDYMAPYLLQNRGLIDYARKYPQIANVRVFVPATKHYSWPKSGTILGLGQDSVVGIPVDDNCRMDIDKLREYLMTCAQSKIPVLMVVAVIGSTEEGVVDNLEGILDLRDKFKGLHFILHCDAAWGGYLRTMITPPPTKVDAVVETEDGFVLDLPLSAYAQKQYRLLSKADTVTIDPHKAGFVPYPAGSLCYRNGLLRYLITFSADYIHSAKDLNMGIFGVEGSKPGAAPAAVWMAHRAIPLDTSGYGQILGECSFSTKLYYCYWLTLADEKDDFCIEPLIPLPDKLYNRQGKVIAEGKQEILSYIRQNIIGKTNEELVQDDSDALSVLQQVGSDVLINSFVVNFKSNGQWNRKLDLLNQLNQKLFNKFSITDPDQAAKDDVDFILTESQLDTTHYQVPLERICRELGIQATGDYSMNFLINTILQPWPTTHHFIQTIMDTFKRGVEDCIPELSPTPLKLGLAEIPRDQVVRIPGDSTVLPSRCYELENSYAGYATAEEGKGNSLFYWFFESRCQSNADTPLVIWLNGGPGASSLAGLFLENGPFTLNNDSSIIPNQWSWNEQAHMLFWDQPVGTGFSVTGTKSYVKDEVEMARQFVNALEYFFGRHQEYLENPLFLTGESYAGKYIPYIAQEITKRNQNNSKSPINLKGLAIGDGWMTPALQTYDQIRYAYMLGLVDTLQMQAAQEQYKLFLEYLEAKQMEKAFDVGSRLSDMLVKCGGGENIYDVRSWKDAPIEPLKTYLSSKLVKSCIHVPEHVEWKFADAEGPVSENLKSDLMASVTDLFPELVNFEKDQAPAYKLLFYTGNFDMSCGFTGTEQILRNMKWKHGEQWLNLKRRVWYKTDDQGNKQSLGCIKSYRNLTQIEIPMSGHQVPMFQPTVSREMIYNWLFGIDFESYDPLQEESQG
jgi:vitellogenic carboxypeptidase-like protein